MSAAVSPRKLVWFTLNCSYSHSSLALPLIHAACSGVSGWEWERLESTVESDPAELAADLAARQPDLVCATLYLFNRAAVLDVLARFRALDPAAVIAAGGPECSGSGAAKLLRQCPFLTLCCQGEGEVLIPDLLRNFPPRPGTILAAPDGSAARIAAFDETAVPADDPFFRTDKPFVQIETSRGCPMHCRYCTSAGTPLRFKSPEAVRRELAALQARGVREIRLLDRTFNFPAERGAQLLRLFREDFPAMRFHLEIHPQLLDSGLRRELAAAPAGQLHVEAGIQSLDDAVQRAIGRGSPREKVLDGVRFLCSQTNFATHVDLLAGLPEQSFASLAADVETLLEIGPDELQLEVLKLLPGTPFGEDPAAYGLTGSPLPPYDVMQSRSMTAPEILRARRLSRLLDLTANHPALHAVMRAANRAIPHFPETLLDFFLERGFSGRRLYDLKSRFLLLAEFLQRVPAAAAAAELAYGWIAAGFPPEAVPAPAPRPERGSGVPSRARLIAGEARSASDRETRFWTLTMPCGTVCFAFNRRYRANLPSAIWKE